MLSKWKVFPFGCVLVCAAVLGGSGSMTKPLDGLRSEDPGVREEAERQILESHKETVLALESLIEENLRGDYMREIIRSKDKGERIDPKYLAAASAMNVLGELRSAHSVPLLVRHLRFSITRGRVRWRLPGIRDFPAANALTKIGLPAVAAVLEEHKRQGDPRRYVIHLVINEVLGRELATTYVRNAIAAEKDPEMKARLEQLLPPPEAGE